MAKKMFYGIVLVICLSNNAFCFDDRLTHPDITEKAVSNSNLGPYLKNNLELKDGIDTKFPSNSKDSVRILFKKGATDEDDPDCRASNHFHNPLLSWDQSQMTDDILTWKGRRVRATCQEDWPFLERKSNITWATGYLSPAPNGAKVSMDNQEMNWDDAREYFRLALTESDKTVRETNFAKTFQSIGQVMHLMEDMAVPAHVRNDLSAHLIWRESAEWGEGNNFYDKFINWVAASHGNGFEHYMKNNPGLVSGVNDAYVKSLAESIVTTDMPITSFWDTNTYEGTNHSTSISQGLSEYTNSNFLSEFTIFTENKDPSDLHYFPHPSKSDTYAELVEVIAEDGQTDHPWYVKKIASNYKLVAYSFSKKLIEDKEDEGYDSSNLIYEGWKYNLDDEVYKDYAGELIPRAVAYPAGLINYFFRGELYVNWDGGGLTITNNSSEVMTSFTDINGNEVGEINIYYDDVNSTRRHLMTHYLPAPLAPGETTPVISFYPPDDNVKPGRYIVVFHGKLGSEEGAVIGLVTVPSKIFYVSRRNGVYKIYSIDEDGNNERVVYDNQDASITIGKISLSPDKKSLAFARSDGPSIYLLDLESGNLRWLTLGDWPGWSPDGTKIVFQRDSNNYLPLADVELSLIDVQTQVETKLTDVNGSSYSAMPAWSPDGSKIAYVRVEAEGCQNLYAISIIDPSGNPLGPVTCQDGINAMDAGPVWSPDSKEIAFMRRIYRGSTPSYYELYKVTLEGQQLKKLTTSTGFDYAEFTPSWSNDGKNIAVGSNMDGDFDVWLVDPSGRNGYKKNLTDSNLDIDGYPAFSW